MKTVIVSEWRLHLQARQVLEETLVALIPCFHLFVLVFHPLLLPSSRNVVLGLRSGGLLGRLQLLPAAAAAAEAGRGGRGGLGGLDGEHLHQEDALSEQDAAAQAAAQAPPDPLLRRVQDQLRWSSGGSRQMCSRCQNQLITEHYKQDFITVFSGL